ncbi:bub2 protein [Polychytrium aggregatum]|uniref:bub2 protein n=1 Tax=Polychytrium aggregatum TaxID=110093 RepID=UPI0022FE8A2E|nr:bub2 protein [Polychytrium aggregatum]KAI9201983.1 bub2 protein [Polychytrium aggregatum]
MSHTNSSALSSSGLSYSLDAALFQKSPALSSSVSVASASSATSSAAPTSLTGRPISHDSLRAKYESILNSRNSTDRELRESLKKLRMLVVMNGMPDNSDDPTPQHGCSLKGRVWKCLLGVYSLSAKDYSRLIDKGPCDVYDKIKNDTFRTMATDRKFTKRVQENMLSRALNAFVWKVKELPTHRLLNLKFSYVQGMNVLMAPFLYCMPELDAFHAYAQFIQHVCPLYVQPAMEGVHCGVKLLEQCLKILDPELYSHLKRKKVEATVYAFPSVLTLCACTPPLSELLKLWDFLLAYGVHLNILCIVAQLMMMRTKLLSRPSPGSLLRTLPPLNAKEISAITIALVPQLPDDLYDWLARHPYDATIYEQMIPELEEEEKELGW